MPTFLTRLTNLLFPRQCAICGKRLLLGEELFCSSCNIQLPRTYYALSPYDNPMAQLFWGRFPLEKAVALIHYNSHTQISKPFYDMKYHNMPEIGVSLGVFAAKELMSSDFFNDIDIIVPMPLARWRKMERGYNQSEKIAFGVSHITHIPMAANCLKRTVFKESQTNKNKEEREENVKDCFILHKPQRLQGKHVLIIDDIVTTGATCHSAAKEIMKAEGTKISIMSIGVTKE